MSDPSWRTKKELRGVAAALALLPGAAMAQQGATPTAAGAPTAAAPGAGGAAAIPATPARVGLGNAILDDEPLAAPGEEAVASSRDVVPEVHLVQRRDTLWDISSTYFQNPWFWPKLWSYNPLITNPHWIYPGDTIRLLPPGAARPLPPPATDQEPETPRLSLAAPIAATGIALRQNGFLEQGEIDASATIVGSREEKMMLATLDEAYVEFKADHPMKPGERFTVYRTVDAVKHPETGRVAGSIVEILGEVEVRGVTGNRIARCVIVDATGPIERGFRVGPLRRQYRLVEPTPSRSDIDAVVLATLLPTRLVGAEVLVFIDRGEKDEVGLGNRFLAVRRGDGYTRALSEKPQDDRRFPREVVAELLVIDVRERTSTALVLRATKEVRIGDRLETRKGP